MLSKIADQLSHLVSPASLKEAEANWELIVAEFAAHAVVDDWNLACIFATVMVETGDTLMPVSERGSNDYLIRNYWTIMATRKALGNTLPTDAIKFKGRGFIQLTGRYNYTQVQLSLNLDLLNNPALANEPEHASRILFWFWEKNGLVSLCASMATTNDKQSQILTLQAIRKRVNGGLNGWDSFLIILKRLELT